MLVVAELKRCVSDDHEVLEKPLRVMFAAVDELNSDAFDVILTAETARSLENNACYTVLKVPSRPIDVHASEIDQSALQSDNKLFDDDPGSEVNETTTITTGETGCGETRSDDGAGLNESLTADPSSPILPTLQTETDSVLTSSKLAALQRADKSLSKCFELAKLQKNGIFVQNNLLYHSYKIAGQKIMQLCVPFCKREQLLSARPCNWVYTLRW